MLSLKERIEWLERELPPNPPRFRIHDELPFAILRYDPQEEWALRREAKYLATRLSNAGLQVVTISLAELMWEAIEKSEGVGAIVALEKEWGFDRAQEQVNVYLSDPDFSPLRDLLVARLAGLDPQSTVCFLMRAGGLAPEIYHVSKLLEEMQGRTTVPTVLFYPGLMQGANSLLFMGLPGREPPPVYRVKIYG